MKYYKFILLLSVLFFAALTGSDGETQTWKTTLVSKDEPGDAMIIFGVVYAPDGETPLPGIKVHVYHTDAEGYYSRPGRDESRHRIKGDMITNSGGRYQFRSIKPASYPDSRVPSHVHYVVSGEGYPGQRFNLEFKGDPHISDDQYQREAKNGKFADIVPLQKDEDGILRGEFNIKLRR